MYRMKDIGIGREGRMIELDRRLRKLAFDDVVDWMDDRYAARAWNYWERVGDVFATVWG